jgi:hypothetical protein
MLGAAIAGAHLPKIAPLAEAPVPVIGQWWADYTNFSEMAVPIDSLLGEIPKRLAYSAALTIDAMILEERWAYLKEAA